MTSSLALIFASTACGVFGQLTLKMGMNQLGRIGGEALIQPVQVLLRVLTNPLVIVGLGLYVLGAAIWLTVLSRVPLSFAYPLLALNYVIVPLLAWSVLGESLPVVRWMGIGVICLGVILVSRG